MTCTVADRQRVECLSARLAADERCLFVSEPLPPQSDPADAWSLEVHLAGRCAGFPTELLAGLAYDVTVRCAQYNGLWRATLLV